MTRNQYEQHKQRLEEQLRAGIQLLESAYQAQVRALELVWMLQAEAGGEALVSPQPAAAPSPAKQKTPLASNQPRRRGIANLEVDVRAALPQLPETFTRRDVCRALGYEPDRGSLYRILQELVQKGSIGVQSVGEGQKPTVYRKAGAQQTPEPG